MSSWLLDTGSGAAGGGGAGLGAAAAGLAAGAIADGGISFITGGLAAGAGAATSGLADAGGGLAGFSAAAGFASSSAMMRRIGRQNLLHRGLLDLCRLRHPPTPHRKHFTPSRKRICRFRDMQAGIFIAAA